MSSKPVGSLNPHAVCVPGPTQSHIKAMLKLAKLLHHAGFHITFVNTEFNHKRFLRARGSDSLKGFSDFRFEQIPDGLPQSEADATQEITLLFQASMTFMVTPFCSLLAKLNDTASASSDIPPVTCIVSDVFMPFTAKAAQGLGIPLVLFSPIAACAFMGFYQYHRLLEKGLAPVPDESYLTNGYLDTKIDWIPGMKDIRLKDLPTFFRTTDPNDITFNFCLESFDFEKISKAWAVLVQTFDDLEVEVLDSLSHMFPRVYTVGPLQLLLDQISYKQNHLKSIGYNLWKEERECLQWLNSKALNSVIYVNFGSIIVVTPQQLLEFCWGLSDSKCNFLWIIRPDLVVGEAAVLPPEFLDETKERGLLAGWCPQEQVLNHSSVGGFLTHSGWNSTMESLSAGVPMLCWPFFADQQTNCRYTCKEWGIGMEIDSNAKSDEIKRMVKDLIDGDKGKKLRNKALEWKKTAENASSPEGSSTLNLDKLVKGLFDLKK